MAPAMLLLLSILLGLCDGYPPSQQCNGNGSKQELAKKSYSLLGRWFVYLSTLHMCRAKPKLVAADRLGAPPTSASNGVTVISWPSNSDIDKGVIEYYVNRLDGMWIFN